MAIISQEEKIDKENGVLGKGETSASDQEVQKLKEELARREGELRTFKEKEGSDKQAELSAAKAIEKEKKIEKQKERIKESPEKPGKVTLPTKTKTPTQIKDDDLAKDLQKIMSLDKPKQVKTLVYLAFRKGIHYAVNIAEQLKDPYLLDEFHDTLVDHLYELLKNKKKI